jgi:hypothetical protein
VALAHSFKIARIAMAENGLIALNPPLEVSRVGSLSTRTAHPLFLIRFLQTMADLGAFDGELENPFLFESKTDVVRAAPSWTLSLLGRSVSCAKPNKYQQLGVLHCGYCIPCLHRRVAFIRAGIDRPRDYAYDALRNLNALVNKLQADFRALVRFAARIQNASAASLAAMVLSHGHFAPESAARLGHQATSYTPWTDMLRRWAHDFLDIAQSRSSLETARIVGLSKRRRAHTP